MKTSRRCSKCETGSLRVISSRQVCNSQKRYLACSKCEHRSIEYVSRSILKFTRNGRDRTTRSNESELHVYDSNTQEHSKHSSQADNMMTSTTAKPSPLEGKIKVAQVAERYRVSTVTVSRWVAAFMFPAPVAVGGVRYWSERDLELFDQWCVDRSKAAIHGGDPDDVAHPSYSIPMPTLDEILEATA